MGISHTRGRGSDYDSSNSPADRRKLVFNFLKRKSTKDYLKEVAVELREDRHYIIVVPDDTEPQDIMDTGFFENYSVLIVQAGKLTIMEIG